MAEVDVVIKRYMSDKVRFADLINGSMFGGKQVVKPENLQEISGEADLFLTDSKGQKKTLMRYRDVVMRADFAILAVEDQMKVHYAMPVRSMLYDALSYTEQVEQIRKEHEIKGEKLRDAEFLSGMKKEDKIIPVITTVVYYGEEEWDGSLDLYGMMGFDEANPISEELKEVLPNYKINLLHAGNIEKLENYKSSLQLVFGMLKYKSDKEKFSEYLETNRSRLENMDVDTYNAVGVLLHEEKRLKQYMEKKEEEYGMCKAIDDLIEDGRNEGISLGLSRGINQEKLRIAKEIKGLLPDEVVAEKTGLSLEVVKAL